MTVTLYTRYPFSAYAASSEALVSFLGLDVKVEYVSGKGEAPKEFLDLFPENFRFTPSLYDSEKKLALNQSIAVNEYLVSLAKDKKGLLGKKPEDAYEVLQWSNIADSDIFQKLLVNIVAKVTGGSRSQEELEESLARAERGFSVFENHLQKNTYLVGETLTLADIQAAGLLSIVFLNLVSPKWQKSHRAVTRWARTILNSKAFEGKFHGQFKFGSGEAAKFFATEQPKKEQPKKAEEAAPAQEKKPKHPLEELGKPKIPIDELKRTYSNKETREEALPWFWNEFYDDEEWSLWRFDFKYNDELTLTFMSNNQIGGFFNRLSASTKYLFGAGVVYGENNNNGIRGAFVVRGKDYAPAFDVAPDWESYTFTRLDANKPDDRAELEDLWAWDRPIVVNGEKREIVDGKVFK